MNSLSLHRAAVPVAAVLALCVFWFGRDTLAPSVISRLVLPVIWLGIWSFACIGVGRPVVGWLQGAVDDPAAEVLVSLAGGAALLATAATLFAWMHVLNPIVLGSVLYVSAVAGLVSLIRRPISLAWHCKIDLWSGVIVFGAWGALALLLTSPPVMFDVLHYHLAFPAAWLREGGFVDFARHGFSYYPSGHGMTYVYALVAIGPWGASAIHWWFGALAALAAFVLGRRLGGGRAGWWALALFALTPAVLECADFAMADLAVAAWGGAAYVVLSRTSDAGASVKPWALAGILCGAALSAKYLALATVGIPIAAFVLVGAYVRRERRLLPMIMLAGVALLVFSPWLVRNFVATSNPLYPYFQSLLGGPVCSMSISRELTGNELPIASSISVLANSAFALLVRSFEPVQRAGIIGLQWILLLPLAFALRGVDRKVVMPLAAAVITGLFAWGGLVQFARFLFPVLVPAAAFAGAVASRLVVAESRIVARCFHGLLIVLMLWNASVLATELNYQRLGVVIGRIPTDTFLRSWVSYQPAVHVINEVVPDDAVVMVIADPRAFYFDRTLLVEDSYRLPWLLELAEQSVDARDLARRVRALGVTHILVNEGHMKWAARLRGEENYWDGSSAGSQRRVFEFLDHHVEKIFVEQLVWVGKVSDE